MCFDNFATRVCGHNHATKLMQYCGPKGQGGNVTKEANDG